MIAAADIMFNSREFVACIRRSLDEAGFRDIPVRRDWIDEDEPGFAFLMNVPLGPDLVVPLRPLGGRDELERGEQLDRHVRHFAMALVNLNKGEGALRKYVAAVRKEAVEQIALARRSGLDLGLERVGLKPSYAYHLSAADWKDAITYVLAALKVRCTSFHLRPEVCDVYVENPGDVAERLADTLEDQTGRQLRIAELEAMGADLIVDAVTLDLLKAYGFSDAEVLTRVWKEQCVILIQDPGEDLSLSLVSCNGKVEAQVTLRQAHWNGEHLWLRGEEQDGDHRGLVGGCLGDLVPHAAFTSRPIVDVFRRHVDHFVFDLSEKFAFDASSGSLRPLAARLVA